MSTLPITHLTLYKHGVAFFRRRGSFEGEEVTLTFREEEMNDVLKSLTAIDAGPGQVLAVDYATPQSREERLAGNSVRLDDRRSLRDLLVSLRGRRVRLVLDQDELWTGTLLGPDELPAEQEVADSPVSLLLEDTHRVRTGRLGRVQEVELLDDEAAADLRFFLDTALGQEEQRRVTLRLTPGEHDLSVSYVAPAPTWRVSYRLVADPHAGEALLMAWGIFDNRLDEDLEEISLSLVAGMPISFVYDLYTPFTPERPEVKEEGRVAAAPVDFAAAVREEAAEMEVAAMAPPAMAAPEPRMAHRRALTREAMRESALVTVAGEDLGELFQYNIGAPVSVGRGKSAMVPIISTDLDVRKDLLYNSAKFPEHPVASMRLENSSGLTLERGPVTVIEGGEYVGEAILPFTAAGAELLVPYAAELNVRVQEQRGTRRELHALHVQGAYLIVEQWQIRWREYQLNNQADELLTVVVEHPRDAEYELFQTTQPLEKSDEHWRFAVEVPARGERTLRVQERTLRSRREHLQRQSYDQLGRYLRQGLIDRATHDELLALLRLWERIELHEERIAAIELERQQAYQAQEKMQGNLQALSDEGKEGALRTRYVRQLGESEDRLQELAQEERQLRQEIERLEEAVAQQLQELGE